MGGGSTESSNESSYSNSSSSQSSSNSRTFASELSNEQLKILQERNAQYNNLFYPELQKSINATNSDSKETAATMASQAGQINSAFSSGAQNTNQNLAQQGLLGDASGVQAALQQNNERSRSSALAKAYNDTLSENANKKAVLLGIGASMMPKATTSAEYYQESSSQSTSSGEGSGSSSGSSSGWSVKGF